MKCRREFGLNSAFRSLIVVSLLLCGTSHGADRLPTPFAATDASATAATIDRLIADALFTDATRLAPRSNDATYLRRVYLDLIGDVPTPEEVAAFVLDPAKDKRARVVERLLANKYFGQNWARYWRDVILYRRVEDRALIASKAITVHMAKQLNDDAPWSEIATSFVTATGDVREDGATAIYFAQDGRTEETTAEFSRIFLGIRIQCAQCHDHPYDRWKREQFHEFAAFFPRVGVRPVRSPTQRSFEVMVNDSDRGRGKNPNNANRQGLPEHYMSDLEDPASRGTLMQPKFFLSSQSLPFGTKDNKRRKSVARWLTKNEWFAKAFVNRMWAEMVGTGFFEEVDDIGPDRVPTAGPALDALADGFVQNDYSVKWLVETICQTEAYQRESRPHETADFSTPFASNIAQPLRADQLFNALLTALEIDESEDAMRGGVGASKGGLRGRGVAPRDGFNVAFGYDPSDPRDDVSATIPQVLAMMNAPVIANAIRGRSGRTMLGRLLLEIPNDDDLTFELYLRCLAREPSAEELSEVLAYVDGVSDRREAFEDVLWALLNSAEFKYRR